MLLTLGIIVLVGLVVFAIRRANAVDESCCAVPPKVTPPANTAKITPKYYDFPSTRKTVKKVVRKVAKKTSTTSGK